MIERKSLVEQIYDHIISGIQSKEYKPGDRLIIEELTKKLGVSRTPIREAIGKLAQDGFVTMVHNVGPRVAELDIKQISELAQTNSILFDGLLKVVFEDDDLDDLTQTIGNIVEMQEEAFNRGDEEVFLNASIEFHIALINACKNDKLKQVTMQTQRQMNISVIWYQADFDIRRAGLEEHKQLLELLKQRKLEEFITEFRKHNDEAMEYFVDKGK